MTETPKLAENALSSLQKIEENQATYFDAAVIWDALKKLKRLENLQPKSGAVLAPVPPGGRVLVPSDIDLWSIGAEVGNFSVDPFWPLKFARAVLSRYGHQCLTPIALTERQPGPEDCDAEGRCWVLGKVERDWRLVSMTNSGIPKLTYCFSHWLPHDALPLPEVG